MPHFEAFHVSATTGEGIDRWTSWLEARRAAARPTVSGHHHHHHEHAHERETRS
jgi:hypothetical protein